MQVITDRPKVVLAIGLLAGVTSSAFAELGVTPSNNANTLANAILGGGITLNSANYSGAAGASGTFNNGNSASLGFDSGIVLTTGAASVAGNLNTGGNIGTDNGSPGDGYLNSVLGGNTFNAARLIMNFTISPTASGNLFFNFVFASEEYNEWSTSQFNDVLAFKLDGVNIALLPDNTTRVAVHTVNAGVNSAYFRNNRPGETLSNPGTPGPYGIEYDGLTTVLTASAQGLAPGPHVIELAIADATDPVLDSAVFIQGGSFTTVPEPTTGALLLLPLGAKAARMLRKGRTA